MVKKINDNNNILRHLHNSMFIGVFMRIKRIFFISTKFALIITFLTTLFSSFNAFAQDNNSPFVWEEQAGQLGLDVVNPGNTELLSTKLDVIEYSSVERSLLSGRDCVENGVATTTGGCFERVQQIQCDYSKEICRVRTNKRPIIGGVSSQAGGNWFYLRKCSNNFANKRCDEFVQLFQNQIVQNEPQNIADLIRLQNQTPTTSGQTPTTSGQTPTTSGQTPTTPGQTPTTSGQTPTTSGQTPTTPELRGGTSVNGNSPNSGLGTGQPVLDFIIGLLLSIIGFFIWLFGAMFAWLLNTVAWVMIFLIRLNPASSTLVTALEPAWRAVVQLGNILVVSGFFFVGFGYVLDIKSLTQDIKQFLTGIVIFGVLLQFTLYGSAAVVNIFQGMGDTLIAVVSQGGDPNQALAGKLLDGLNQIKSGNEDLNPFSGDVGRITSEIAGETVFLVAVLFGLFVFSKAAFLALGRLITLWFLMMLSPIALGATFTPIPGIQTFGRNWADKFIKLAIFYPAFVIALLIGNYFADRLAQELLRDDSAIVREMAGGSTPAAFINIISRVLVGVISIGILAGIVKFFSDEFNKYADAAISGVSAGAKNLVNVGKTGWSGVQSVYKRSRDTARGISLATRSANIARLSLLKGGKIREKVDEAEQIRSRIARDKQEAESLKARIEALQKKADDGSITTAESARLARLQSALSDVDTRIQAGNADFDKTNEIARRLQASLDMQISRIRAEKLPFTDFEERFSSFFRTLPFVGDNQKKYAEAITKSQQEATRAQIVIGSLRDGSYVQKYSTLEGYRIQDIPELAKAGIYNYKDFQEKLAEYREKNPGATDKDFIQNKINQIYDDRLRKNLGLDIQNLPLSESVSQLKQIQEANNYADLTPQAKQILINALKDPKIQSTIANNPELRPLVDNIRKWYDAFDAETQDYIQEKLPGFLPKTMENVKLAVIEAILQGGEDAIESFNFGANLAVGGTEMRKLIEALGGSNKKIVDALNMFDKTNSAFNDRFALAGKSKNEIMKAVDELLLQPYFRPELKADGTIDKELTRRSAEQIIASQLSLVAKMAQEDVVLMPIIERIADDLENNLDSVLSDPQRKQIIDRGYAELFYGANAQRIIDETQDSEGIYRFTTEGANDNVKKYFENLRSSGTSVQDQLKALGSTTIGNRIVNSTAYKNLANDELKMMFAERTFRDLAKNLESNFEKTNATAEAQAQKVKLYHQKADDYTLSTSGAIDGFDLLIKKVNEIRDGLGRDTDVKTEISGRFLSDEATKNALTKIGAKNFGEDLVKSIRANPKEVIIAGTTYNLDHDVDATRNINRKLSNEEKTEFAAIMSNIATMTIQKNEVTGDKRTELENRIKSIVEKAKSKLDGTIAGQIINDSVNSDLSGMKDTIIRTIQADGSKKTIDKINNEISRAAQGGLTGQQLQEQQIAIVSSYLNQSKKELDTKRKDSIERASDEVLASSFDTKLLDSAKATYKT